MPNRRLSDSLRMMDQLLGRLNRKRGCVGIFTCRQIRDRSLMLKRCRDVVNDGEKHIIVVLEDSDICAILNFAAADKRKEIDEYMEDRLEDILT